MTACNESAHAGKINASHTIGLLHTATTRELATVWPARGRHSLVKKHSRAHAVRSKCKSTHRSLDSGGIEIVGHAVNHIVLRVLNGVRIRRAVVIVIRGPAWWRTTDAM